MANSPRDLPTPDEERELHRRLMEFDPVAPSDLADAFVSHLVGWLRRTNSPKLDEHLIVDAAADAIFALSKKPDSYRIDGERSLFAYLQMSAKGDLKNALKKRTRQLGRQVELDSVELSADVGNTAWDVDDPLDAMITAEEAEHIRRELLPIVRAGLSAEECACLELYLDGERKTEPYAKALQIESLPIDEQRRQVKQVKDMLKQRIKRGRTRHE
jgi:RNA polymerase sigma-70 factor (ECF subfamily)